jgi:hypothetical protein
VFAVLAVAAAGPSAAAGAEPYDDWNPALAGFPSDTPASPRANCAGGSDQCIDRTIGEMWRRFHRVVPHCDHNNVFSLTYLRVTEDVREGVDEGFWPDLHWINKQDAMFARLYFLAYDNYRAGRTELVPQSWRVAFGASEAGDVQGLGNLLLSMNAHINRDFPFILYKVGLRYPDGRTRKPDHDAYGTRLRALYKPMLKEIAARFDPTTDDYDVPGTIADDDAFFELLVQWRETAWQNARKLAEAKTDAERREVAAGIEAYANFWADLIYSGAQYPPGQGPEARNAFCAEHGGQLGRRYKRGADVARPVPKRARLTSDGLELRLSCPDGPGPCVGRVTVRAPGDRRPLGGRRFEIGRGKRGPIVIPVGPDSGAGRLRVKVRSRLGPGVTVARRASVALGR